MPALGPRLVIAGTSSGVGKTTVATGLMAALRQRGLVVGAAKVGPDYIETGYHALATDRPARNLDSWLCGTAAVAPLAGRASEGWSLARASPRAPSTREVCSQVGRPTVGMREKKKRRRSKSERIAQPPQGITTRSRVTFAT